MMKCSLRFSEAFKSLAHLPGWRYFQSYLPGNHFGTRKPPCISGNDISVTFHLSSQHESVSACVIKSSVDGKTMFLYLFLFYSKKKKTTHGHLCELNEEKPAIPPKKGGGINFPQYHTPSVCGVTGVGKSM